MSADFRKTGQEVPFSMPDQMDTHQAFKSKGMGYKLKRVLKNHLTGASYEDSFVLDARLFSNLGFIIKNKSAVNTCFWKILGCVDPDFWEEIQSETSINAATQPAMVQTTKPFLFVKIQVKSNSGACFVDAFIVGKTP